jgi:hypothetical protein
MHVTAFLDAMKKRGHFKDYDRAQKAYEEAKKVAELAEAGLALLKGTSAEMTSKHKKKALAKAKEATKEALAKAQEIKPETKDAEEAPGMTENSMKAGFQADLEKAKQAQETAQSAMTPAANLMFTFYSNFFSLKSKYEVRMEQDRRQADGRQPKWEPTRCLTGRPKGNVSGVI